MNSVFLSDLLIRLNDISIGKHTGIGKDSIMFCICIGILITLSLTYLTDFSIDDVSNCDGITGNIINSNSTGWTLVCETLTLNIDPIIQLYITVLLWIFLIMMILILAVLITDYLKAI